jgi:hypothetical protein
MERNGVRRASGWSNGIIALGQELARFYSNPSCIFFCAATPDENGMTFGILPQSVDQNLCHTRLCRRSIILTTLFLARETRTDSTVLQAETKPIV